MARNHLRSSILLLSFVMAARAAAAQAPLTPAHLRALGTAPGTVTVSWDPVAGATSYRVYADVDPIEAVVSVIPLKLGIAPNGQLIATVTGTTATQAGLAPLVRRFYAVEAVNDDGTSQPTFADRVVVPAQPDAAIFGFADLHTHQFSNLGFGRKLVWGNAFSPAGIFDALSFCNPAHGILGAADLVGNFLRNNLPIGTHSTAGGSDASDVEFDGWPSFDTFTHQQMYHDWVRRAFDGGLRLLVVHAVNNELLCQIQGHDAQFSCADMDTVDDQLLAAKQLEAYIDSQSGGPGQGWYRIAYSGTEARQIINSGRMAVVLGLEVDTLFRCGLNSTCTDAQVIERLDDYYAKGVRHLFPVHVFDNAFGGAAIYNPLFTWGNQLQQNAYFVPRECGPEGYRYKQPGPGPLELVVGTLLGLSGPPATTFAAECNARGLQGLGDTLIRGMLTRKMVLDIDHMSARTADAALHIAEEIGYPAVVGGHTGVLSNASGQQANEGLKTSAQVARMRALGGMIGLGLAGNRADSSHPDGFVTASGSTVLNDCGWSSKVFAQNYLAGMAAFGGAGTAALAIGSDFNGLVAAPGPRIAGKACWGDGGASPQSGGVTYPFPIFAPPGVNAGHLPMAPSPRRFTKSNIFANAQFQPWDYNSDGVAHIGLIPDFIQDLRNVGITDAQLQPLFRSAEAYVHMWEASEQININPPVAAISQLPNPNANGWNAGDVTVSISGSATIGGSAVTNLVYTASGATTAGPATIAGAAAQLVVSQEGSTVVSATAQDAFRNTSPAASLTVHIDKTAPSVTCQSADGLWHAGDVSLACSATDAISGLAPGSVPVFSLSTAVPAGTETSAAATDPRQVFDLAGNVSTAGPVGGNRIDKKAPSISIGIPAGATYVVNQVVAASYGCVDGGAGVNTCAGPVADGAPLDTTHPGSIPFVVNATDNVNNPSSASASYIVGYAVCAQYDTTKVKKAGSVVPIKIQLCDVTGNNLSAAGIVVTATNLTRVGSAVTGVVEDAGNANPDNNFRFDTSTRTYIFNLSTKGLAGGTWTVNFTVPGDPVVHSALFQIQ